MSGLVITDFKINFTYECICLLVCTTLLTVNITNYTPLNISATVTILRGCTLGVHVKVTDYLFSLMFVI
jgi:hypothetical protein